MCGLRTNTSNSQGQPIVLKFHDIARREKVENFMRKLLDLDHVAQATPSERGKGQDQIGISGDTKRIKKRHNLLSNQMYQLSSIVATL